MPTQPSTQDGTIFTVAGSGRKGFGGDGGDALRADFSDPHGVAVDAVGNLYIADASNQRVRKVGTDGVVVTVAGTGHASGGFSGDGGPAVDAMLNGPYDVAVDGAGNLYIADYYNNRVRKVDAHGVITTVAGNGGDSYTADSGPATQTSIHHPTAVAIDGQGNLCIAHRQNDSQQGWVHKVAPDNTVTHVAGGGGKRDGAPAELALDAIEGLAVDGAGNVYIADRRAVHKVAPDGTASRFAGAQWGDGSGETGDGGRADEAKLAHPSPAALAVDGAGNVFIADQDSDRVRMVTPDGIIHTVAGNGNRGQGAEGALAYESELNRPVGLAVDANGTLYISEEGNNRVRREYGAANSVLPKPAVADLYGEVVSPHTVQRGREFDLGVRVKNRGPHPVDGGGVTVVLTLAEGLAPADAEPTRRLSRTFPGARLVPNDGSLDGVFRVIAPDLTPAGVYESQLEIQYAGELDLKDNTFTFPVVVVVPSPVADETALDIHQETPPEVGPGQDTKYNVVYSAPTGKPVNPGVITQRFTAPTGFVFTGKPTYGYYSTPHGVITGNLDDFRIEDNGRTLVIEASPHVNTSVTDTSPLVYTLPMRALADAVPGTYTDGSASIGKHQPVQITGIVKGGSHDETALVVTQQSEPEAAPGGETTFNLSFRSLGSQPVNPGTLDQRITAPTGFTFTGGASYGYYYVRPQVTGNLETRLEDGGRTLVITSNPHVNTGDTDRTELLYTLTVRALPEAVPGEYDDGRAVIGRLTPVPLTGRVR